MVFYQAMMVAYIFVEIEVNVGAQIMDEWPVILWSGEVNNESILSFPKVK